MAVLIAIKLLDVRCNTSDVRYQGVEPAAIQDLSLVAAELDDALAFQPAAGPNDGFERQAEVIGEVGSCHRDRYLTVRPPVLFLEQMQHHRQPAQDQKSVM